MSAPQAAAITACTACAAVGGAAAGGAFSSGTSAEESPVSNFDDSSTPPPTEERQTREEVPKQEPTWVSLDEEVGSATTYSSGTIGDKYKNLLVGVTGKPDNSNQNWWTYSYNKFKKDQAVEEGQQRRNFSEEFKDITSKVTTGYSTTVTTALNKVCDSIYKSNVTDVEKTEDAKTRLKADLWRYCSSFEVFPVIVAAKNDENTTSTSIGKNKESDLLSTTATENDKIWIYKNTQFKSLTATPTEEIFKDKYAASKANDQTLKEACKTAYTKNSTTASGNPTPDQVVKYCSSKKIS